MIPSVFFRRDAGRLEPLLPIRDELCFPMVSLLPEEAQGLQGLCTLTMASVSPELQE